MKLILAIGTGSFIGGILRYLLSQFIQTKFLSTFPFGTLGVNLLGCFAIGLVFGLSDRGNLTQDWRLFLATGLCGGFTTFSAFSNETFGLLRDGQHWYAIAYIAASVVLGILSTFIGLATIKVF
ncbi:MAG TPA: fluoride efflux transporter CrcB [Chitinophagales bacterium]|nr:fluoride efflux transporter CrcB [Chitinophagales bacterium]